MHFLLKSGSVFHIFVSRNKVKLKTKRFQSTTKKRREDPLYIQNIICIPCSIEHFRKILVCGQSRITYFVVTELTRQQVTLHNQAFQVVGSVPQAILRLNKNVHYPPFPSQTFKQFLRLIYIVTGNFRTHGQHLPCIPVHCYIQTAENFLPHEMDFFPIINLKLNTIRTSIHFQVFEMYRKPGNGWKF